MKKKIRVLGYMMFLDFLLTYLGVVDLNVIAEGNPLMVWLFELPLLKSAFFRILMILVVTFIIRRTEKYKEPIAKFGLLVYAMVLFLHMAWLWQYNVGIQ